MTLSYEKLESYPIIASVNNLDNLELAIESPCDNIFLLTGNIFNLKEISQRVKNNDKDLFIYVDAIDGFSKDTWGLEYIIKNIYLDGIITRKKNLIKLCKDMGVFTIERILIYDTNSLNEGLNSIRSLRPNCIEILPGIINEVIKTFSTELKIPIISSGLISRSKDIENSLSAGAIAVSSSNINMWHLYT
ncbi:glycerol-3-phosphate responsive antiterminator [Paratissierella segnis]|jgi:glycerol uptake operon antiterminator|uniref:Glycerol-3-phosphate responsive antiterminator n=1 Tax=Paratissierella segnis TaxID=2763679 RepID=A0A926EYU2_9FIRM|nr:glycerol-3-phosphate responsive antiterminator [Paratissierella segnis]MBC8588745.1 glycerol-3-phosphate responsive antiterminator [Paratissierella segnis]